MVQYVCAAPFGDNISNGQCVDNEGYAPPSWVAARLP